MLADDHTQQSRQIDGVGNGKPGGAASVAAALNKSNSMLVISGGEGYIDFRVGKQKSNLFNLHFLQYIFSVPRFQLISIIFSAR